MRTNFILNQFEESAQANSFKLSHPKCSYRKILSIPNSSFTETELICSSQSRKDINNKNQKCALKNHAIEPFNDTLQRKNNNDTYSKKQRLLYQHNI